MIQRIKQFYHALKASVNENDMVFIRKYLNKEEQNLFFKMPVFDQRHTLNVAYTAKVLLEDDKDKNKSKFIDVNLLFKACLLHDVGRIGGNFCLWDKVINVLFVKFFPELSWKIAKNISESDKFNRKNKMQYFLYRRKYALYIYYYHAQIGADILSGMGLNKIADIVRYHHSYNLCSSSGLDDSEELDILRRADELN